MIYINSIFHTFIIRIDYKYLLVFIINVIIKYYLVVVISVNSC